MQSPAAPPSQGYPPFAAGPQPFYPPSGYQYPPPNSGYPPYYSWGFPMPYSTLPGSSFFNSGGNSNGSGTQTNGDVKVGNKKEKSGGVDIGSIGGNHGNGNGQQKCENVVVGNIGGA